MDDDGEEREKPEPVRAGDSGEVPAALPRRASDGVRPASRRRRPRKRNLSARASLSS